MINHMPFGEFQSKHALFHIQSKSENVVLLLLTKLICSVHLQFLVILKVFLTFKADYSLYYQNSFVKIGSAA